MTRTFLKGKFVMTPEGLKEGYGVLTEGNMIKAVGPADKLEKELPEGTETIDFGDEMILPGIT